MSKASLFSFLSVAAMSLALAVPGTATTITITPGPSSPLSGGTTFTFDSGAVPAGWTFSTSGSGIAATSTPNVAAEPSNDTTPFAYVGTGGTITYTSPNSAGFTSIGLDWGSPDTFNTLVLSNASTSITLVPGSGLLAGLNPNQATAEYVTISGGAWTTATFTSASAAFEFDNVTIGGTATPEPASIALLAGGLIGVGFLRRRKNA